MDTVFTAVVQLTIATKVMTFKFGGFRNHMLPAPADVKATILDLQEKQDLAVTDINYSMTSMHFVTSKPDVMIKPANTIFNNIVSKFGNKVLRAKESSPSSQMTTTAKAIEKSKLLSSSFHQVPAPVAAVPMPVSIYAQVPVMIPMRTYFEPVIHDHPPLHKIKEMIKKDEKKWKIKEKDCEITVEISYGDATSSDESDNTETDTSSMSEDNDVGTNYYDSFFHINNGGDK